MDTPPPPGLAEVAREWGRIGALGFGGPPAHISLLRELCVERRGWISPPSFEDAIAATNLLPGPASTQLAILCGWRVRGRAGALVGGLCFIAPGLVLILALASVMLGDAPPGWLTAAGAGAGAAVAAVALDAGLRLMGPAARRATGGARYRLVAYGLAGALAAAVAGAGLVLVLIACGLAEVAWRRAARVSPSRLGALHGGALLAAGGVVATGGLGALGWTALKAGMLSYGGGFVIVPLMHEDAVDRHRWMTDGEFLNAVALGQVTPGPVLHTVAAVGYAAAALPGGLLAAAVAFAPSFAFILGGATHLDRLLAGRGPRAFFDGAGPAAIGAILGSAVPLALVLREPWQFGVLAGAALLLLVARRGVVPTLLLAALAGVAVGTVT